MSQTVNVDRHLVFKADAAEQDNVKGNLSAERMHFVEHWFDDTTSALWTETIDGTNDDISPIAGGVTGLKMHTGDTDNEVSFLGTALIFDITNEPEIEAKVRITDIDKTVFFFGFSDANTETSPACTIDYDTTTLAAAATDAAGFLSDADKSTSLYYAAHVATGGSVAAATTGITPTDAAYHVLRIKLDSSGNATWYIDGTPVYYKATAVTDVPLCAIFNAGVRANGAGDDTYLIYFKAWQNQ